MRARLRFILIAAFLSACQSASHPPVDSSGLDPGQAKRVDNSSRDAAASVGDDFAPRVVVVDDVSLQLRGCELLAHYSDGGRHALNVPRWEVCEFSRASDGSVQVIRTKRGPTLLVVSSQPDTSETGERDCDTRIRGIVVARSALLLSENEQRIAMCGVGPFDELMFHVLAKSAR
jgi:hypothetical protein